MYPNNYLQMKNYLRSSKTKNLYSHSTLLEWKHDLIQLKKIYFIIKNLWPIDHLKSSKIKLSFFQNNIIYIYIRVYMYNFKSYH